MNEWILLTRWILHQNSEIVLLCSSQEPDLYRPTSISPICILYYTQLYVHLPSRCWSNRSPRQTIPGVLSDFQHRLSGSRCYKEFWSANLYFTRAFTSCCQCLRIKSRPYRLLCPALGYRSIKRWCASDVYLSDVCRVHRAYVENREA